MDKHELTHGEFLLYFVDLVLIDPPYNVWNGRENTSYQCDILTVESNVDDVAICK